MSATPIALTVASITSLTRTRSSPHTQVSRDGEVFLALEASHWPKVDIHLSINSVASTRTATCGFILELDGSRAIPFLAAVLPITCLSELLKREEEFPEAAAPSSSLNIQSSVLPQSLTARSKRS